MIPSVQLKDIIERSYVLAYREDAGSLVDALQIEHLNPTILRQELSSRELTYSRAVRTFLNHQSAWRLAANAEGYTLICESDFVPCKGMGSFTSFWPLDDDLAWGYLYQGSPRILAMVGSKPYLRGHCAPTVAYVVNARVAKILCDFFEYEFARYDPAEYYTFEAHLQWWAMGRGAKAFIPLRHYGEHGGLPNPEHAQHGISRAGSHRADNLAGPLHFLPSYSRGSKPRFFLNRANARLLGFGRLFSGRWIVDTDAYTNNFIAKLRMFAIGLRRLTF